jgi:hypothetical protein
MCGGELADRGERPSAPLGQRPADRLGGPERVVAADAVRVDGREVRLGLAQREPQRVGDEAPVV